MIDSRVTAQLPPPPVILDGTIGHREDRSPIENFTIDVLMSFPRGNHSAAMSDFLTSESSPTPINQTRDALYVVVPITVIYVLIFFTGLIGNVSTCVVIARNRSMHTATNYYLFSLAVSDLVLLISGLPQEMYYIWSHFPYVFGEVFCIVQSFAAETSANATVLTITAFTVERYVAICHPFISHTMSKLSRAVKYVIFIWVLALCLAIPQAIQFGIVYLSYANGTALPETATCSRKWIIIDHAFEISTMLFFVAPMTIITVLYVLIGIKLRGSRLNTGGKRNPIASGINQHSDCGKGRSSSQRNVIRMLVAVVVAFFICWAPFHAQRLMAVYAHTSDNPPGLYTVYTVLTYISGIFYYLSTTVNPLLYNIMSNKFREAFKSMLSEQCGGRSSQKSGPRRQTYSSLSRFAKSTARRGAERNSGSLSASDETQRPAIRQELVEQRAIVGRDLPSLVDANETSLVLISRDEKDCTNDRRPAANGKHSSNRSTTTTSLNGGQVSGSIATLGCTSVLDRASSNNNVFQVGIHAAKNHRPPFKTVTLGLIAERLRFGTKSLFASQQQRPHNQQQQHQQLTQLQQRGIVRSKSEIAGRVNPKFQSHPSLDSANTISNSSLQDLDETEFTGAELARYMGELNFDLVT